MFRSSRCGRALAIAFISLSVTSVPAGAHSPSNAGGASFAEPDVTGIRCADASATACPRGSKVRVTGENLRATKAVVFLGRRGSADDQRVRPVKSSPHRVVVTVPSAANTGKVRVIASNASVTGPKVAVTDASGPVAQPKQVASAPAGDGAFPVLGKHTYGDGLGAGRGHQGQDVFAACGTQLVAALPGVVTLARWQDAAGNYVVIKAADGTSQVYMHMLKPATVSKGDAVTAGQPIGQVGETGRASGCHLHFEFWTSPGWYEGGEAVDPLPYLKRWDTAG